MKIEPTVFVVDDDYAMRKLLTHLVRSVRLPVETFETAVGFLAAFTPDRPGCLVLDVRIPAMSGLELIGKLRGHRAYANTPILVLTTESGEPFKASARAVGATGWLEKPFDPDMLTELVATLSGAEHPN